MGSRLHILESLESEPVICHISQSKKQKFPIEEIFRSQSRMLCSAILSEFVFVMEFFDIQIFQCSYVFNAIFKKTMTHYLDNLKSLLASSYDITGLTLMILINEANKQFMHDKDVPILDFFFDK